MKNDKNDCRLLVDLGYQTYLMPEGVSADAIKSFVNAIKVETSDGKFYKCPSIGKNQVYWVSGSSIVDFLCPKYLDTNKKVIAELVRRELMDAEHKTVVFDTRKVMVGVAELDWPEGNEIDNFVKEIVELALVRGNKADEDAVIDIESMMSDE